MDRLILFVSKNWMFLVFMTSQLLCNQILRLKFDMISGGEPEKEKPHKRI